MFSIMIIKRKIREGKKIGMTGLTFNKKSYPAFNNQKVIDYFIKRGCRVDNVEDTVIIRW